MNKTDQTDGLATLPNYYKTSEVPQRLNLFNLSIPSTKKLPSTTNSRKLITCIFDGCLLTDKLFTAEQYYGQKAYHSDYKYC